MSIQVLGLLAFRYLGLFLALLCIREGFTPVGYTPRLLSKLALCRVKSTVEDWSAR